MNQMFRHIDIYPVYTKWSKKYTLYYRKMLTYLTPHKMESLSSTRGKKWKDVFYSYIFYNCVCIFSQCAKMSIKYLL